MKLQGKIALITGASAGIGMATAELFAKEGANLILLARRENKLNEIAANLRKTYSTEIITFVCDVRNRSEVESTIENLPEDWKNIDILVNNAGLASGLEKIQDGVIDNWEQMIDTNVKGLLYVSRAVLPGMVQRGKGHVINIGSLAGHELYPAGNVYCATKHAVKAISQGMIIDLNGTGVKVTNVDPGLVETEFSEVRFHGDKDRAKNVYKGYEPLLGADIAEIIMFCLTVPQRVQIQDIFVTPLDQASATIVNKKL